MKKANLASLSEFREKKVLHLEERRITPVDFANSIFGFIVKYHLKPVAKAQTKAQVLLNYYYWITFIERKVVMEEHLIDMGLGTKEQLFQSVNIYVKRRDKMVSRLLTELKEQPEKVIQISPEHFEIYLKDGSLLYASKEVIDEARLTNVQNNQKPKHLIYASRFILPF